MYGVKNGGEDKLKWENPEKKNLKGLRWNGDIFPTKHVDLFQGFTTYLANG